jgi:hypothetical protein
MPHGRSWGVEKARMEQIFTVNAFLPLTAATVGKDGFQGSMGNVITIVSRAGISFLRLSHEVKPTSLTNSSARPPEAVKTFGNLPPVG